MSQTVGRSIVWLSVLGQAGHLGQLGCETASPPTLSTVALEEDYIGQQGTLALGFRDPDIRRFQFPTTITNVRVKEGGRLTADGMSGTDFIGVEFQGITDGGVIDMIIADAIKPSVTGGDWEYEIEEWDSGASAWVPACAEPDLIIPPSSPLPSPPRALAMLGRWTATGLYYQEAASVTFACKTGVVAKCHRWGYPVTMDPPDFTQTGHPTAATGGDMMLACSRLARADYCASGVPNTLDGTYVHFYDAFGGPVPHDPDVPGFRFEAAWPALAAGGRRPAVPRAALCLTKLRWSTIPLGGDCPLQLPDPRTDNKGTFCEDITQADLEADGALLYSDSIYIDAGLHTFHDPPTGARFTTTRLIPDLPDKQPIWLVPDPPEIDFPQPGQRARFEATIFSPDLPEWVPRHDLLPLTSYLCKDTADYVTTSGREPDGCKMLLEEGFVYPPGTPRRMPIRRWWNPSESHSVTTTISPTTMIADGWELVEVVGGAVRGSADVNIRWSDVGASAYRIDVRTRTGEWVQPCIDSPLLGTSTGFVYGGTCLSASGRKVSPANIAAIRVGYQIGTLPWETRTRSFGGHETDVHVDLPGPATALEIAWNEGGADAAYTFAVRDGDSGDWISPCADRNFIANDTSFVFTGECPSAGSTLPVKSAVEIEVCRVDGEKALCAAAPYDGIASRLELRIE